jgi:nucleoside phosphorylase
MSFVPPSTRDRFHIGIICALEIEYNAVALVFDEFWDDKQDQYGKAQDDPNHYTTGRVDKYNVVLALLPYMGKVNAASAAASMRSSYCYIQLALLVRIYGGAPTSEHEEVLLRNMIVSDSVVQYDFGRQYSDKLERKDTTKDNLGRPNKDICSLLAVLGTDRGIKLFEDRTTSWLQKLQIKAASKRRIGKNKYKYPGPAKDKLFKPNYRHKHHNSITCICRGCNRDKDPICDAAVGSFCLDFQCNETHFVHRDRLDEKRQLESENSVATQQPAIHIGAVASEDFVIKSAAHRDRIAKQKNVIAFKMKGAGIWDEMPCVMVKDVCDYADCHKHKKWQNFAAAMAAAAAKAILERYTQTDRKKPEAGLFEILDASQNAQLSADTSGRNFGDVNAQNA